MTSTTSRDDSAACENPATARLSVGVLSFHAHETLKKTLSSYEKGGLAEYADDACVFFNDMTAEDVRICQSYRGWRCEGSPVNLGLLGGMDALAHAMHGDYLLMLQNDCPLIADADAMRRYLDDSMALLAAGKADIVRCRSRDFPGQGFADKKKFERFYGKGWRSALRRLLRPAKARRAIGRAPYAIDDADRRFPSFITRHGDFLIVDSSVINFTDQPFLISRPFMFQLLDRAKSHPKKRTLNGFQVMEINLNTAWWRQSHFKVAVGEGLFTHARFDGGFRIKRAASPA